MSSTNAFAALGEEPEVEVNVEEDVEEAVEEEEEQKKEESAEEARKRSQREMWAKVKPVESEQALRMLVVCGVPGSGKSTITKPLANVFGWGRVNQDEMGTRKSCEYFTRKFLEKKVPVVVDRCNFDNKQRAHWVRLARKYNVPRVECVHIDVPVAECIRRVTQREDHETIASGADSNGDSVVLKMRSMYTQATKDEGFDRVTVFDFHGYPGTAKEVLEELQAQRNQDGAGSSSSSSSSDSKDTNDSTTVQAKDGNEKEDENLLERWSRLLKRVADEEEADAGLYNDKGKLQVPDGHVQVENVFPIKELVSVDGDGRLHVHFNARRKKGLSREHVCKVALTVLGIDLESAKGH